MIKTAIFVEGHAELIFVRHLLLTMFDYQNISLDFFELRSGELQNVPYPYSENEDFHFTIICVGDDKSVASAILKREKYFWKSDYTSIVGLRDIFTPHYRKDKRVKDGKVSVEVNQDIMETARQIIREESQKPDNVFLEFSIMEVEAWFLGLTNIFTRTNSALTVDFIEQNMGFNLENTDPEITFIHPTTVLKKIFGLVNEPYDKHKSQVESIVSHLQKEDYEELYESTKCESFTSFFNRLPNLV